MHNFNLCFCHILDIIIIVIIIILFSSSVVIAIMDLCSL